MITVLVMKPSATLTGFTLDFGLALNEVDDNKNSIRATKMLQMQVKGEFIF